MTDHDEMFVCEQCGHATSVETDACPNCGEPMMPPPGAKGKKSHDEEDIDLDDEALLSDKEIEAGQEDGPMSLEALRAEEEDDEPAYGSEYGNE